MSEKADRDMIPLILVAVAQSKTLPKGVRPAEINNATAQKFMCKEMDDFDIPCCRKTFESIPLPSRGFG